MNGQRDLRYLRWLAAAMLLLTTVGCARLPISGKLAETAAPSRLVSIDQGAPVALDPTKRLLAFGRNGLRILDRSTGNETLLSQAPPTALAWNQAGTRLAAAFSQGSVSRIVLYETVGKEAAATEVPGNVCSISWLSDDDLLFAAIESKPYSFGTDRREMLYRWNGSGNPVVTVLGTTNVKPLTRSRSPWIVSGGLQLAVSPLGDEILFPRFFDPPAFPPYFRIILRNLATGEEREIASISMDGGSAIFADDETVLYGDGVETTHLTDPWESKEIARYPLPGRALAVSGHRIAIDDRMYENGEVIVSFADSSIVGLTSDGTAVLIRRDDTVYLLDGLPKQSNTAEVPTENLKKLLLLRQWRSEGLITPPEYRQMKERILTQ